MSLQSCDMCWCLKCLIKLVNKQKIIFPNGRSIFKSTAQRLNRTTRERIRTKTPTLFQFTCKHKKVNTSASVQFVHSEKADVFRTVYWLDISRKTVRVASSRSYAGLISSIATVISSPSGQHRADRAIVRHRLQVAEQANLSIRLIKIQWSV